MKGSMIMGVCVGSSFGCALNKELSTKKFEYETFSYVLVPLLHSAESKIIFESSDVFCLVFC